MAISLPIAPFAASFRAAACALAATAILSDAPALAQSDGAAFWKKVQSTCDAAAAKPPNETGKRIARAAIDEFNRFGGHQIDANGRLFHFGLTEAEHEEDDAALRQATVGQLGWWQVMKYWRGLFGDNTTTDKLEVLGYRDASTATQDQQTAALLRSSAARLMQLADTTTDPAEREMLREAALRAAIVDTSWSAAFVSYVVKQAGVAADAFRFSNAHRAYIYEAFATSAAEVAGDGGARAFRACPIATRPRPGDLICHQRETALAATPDAAVREKIRGELSGDATARTVRRTHCDVVAHVDVKARKVYSIGGNVNQAVSARKMNLRRGLRFSVTQKGHCGGAGAWTLPQPDGQAAAKNAKCSLNDRKWFVLLQVR